MISKQPTLLRKRLKISVIMEGEIYSQKGKKTEEEENRCQIQSLTTPLKKHKIL